ncbi:MAG: prepilin-type N-terminal cleavage/methylation domain-containing protein [Candidatus Doudnabacteria bacterium]|nr:prepilin-type N-terminal cleavage/methylation domain-containing protein [Candidatus Doudnabacteria bacterium]
MQFLDSKENGFTLIEIVVAATLFAFVVTSLLGVYLSTLRLDSRTRAQRAVSDNARFIMEFMAKEVRNGHIDYTSSGCGSVLTSVTDLCLINQGNEAEHIYAETPSALGTPAGTNLVLAKGASSSNLNSSAVRITKLKFLVTPAHDPLLSSSQASGYNEQPHVTVILELTALSTKDPVKLSLQSTFSQNYYPPRQ